MEIKYDFENLATGGRKLFEECRNAFLAESHARQNGNSAVPLRAALDAEAAFSQLEAKL